jgi:hypothetical protein
MQYVNDDMDELFKRAAENYPLDTRGADWNKVLAALQNETETKTVPEKKGNKNSRFLWLLLLLPFGLICNQLYSPGSNPEEISGSIKEENSIPNKSTVREKGSINNNKTQSTITIDNNTTTNSVILTENSQKI